MGVTRYGNPYRFVVCVFKSAHLVAIAPSFTVRIASM